MLKGGPFSLKSKWPALTIMKENLLSWNHKKIIPRFRVSSNFKPEVLEIQINVLLCLT